MTGPGEMVGDLRKRSPRRIGAVFMVTGLLTISVMAVLDNAGLGLPTFWA